MALRRPEPDVQELARKAQAGDKRAAFAPALEPSQNRYKVLPYKEGGAAMILPDDASAPMPYLPGHSPRRFYMVNSTGMGGGGDKYSLKDGFLNRERVQLPWDQYHGRHHVPFGTPPVDRWLGIPPYPEIPHFRLSTCYKQVLDYSRVSGLGDKVIAVVSDRMKMLLEEIDRDAFEFAPVIVTHGKRKEPEPGPYWALAVIRVVDAMDWDHSVVYPYKFRVEAWIKAGIVGKDAYMHPTDLVEIHDIRFFKDKIKDHHAFYMYDYRNNPIFDEVIVDEIRRRKFTGASFYPLQPPTGKEGDNRSLRMQTLGNTNYWINRGMMPTVEEIVERQQNKGAKKA